jgi:hypothetical protein
MLRVLKPIFLLLLMFIAVGAAGFYVLYFHRMPLPPSAAACPRHSQHCKYTWPFRLLDRNRKNVQPLSHGYDRWQHPGQASGG